MADPNGVTMRHARHMEMVKHFPPEYQDQALSFLDKGGDIQDLFQHHLHTNQNNLVPVLLPPTQHQNCFQNEPLSNQQLGQQTHPPYASTPGDHQLAPQLGQPSQAIQQQPWMVLPIDEVMRKLWPPGSSVAEPPPWLAHLRHQHAIKSHTPPPKLARYDDISHSREEEPSTLDCPPFGRKSAFTPVIQHRASHFSHSIESATISRGSTSSSSTIPMYSTDNEANGDKNLDTDEDDEMGGDQGKHSEESKGNGDWNSNDLGGIDERREEDVGEEKDDSDNDSEASGRRNDDEEEKESNEESKTKEDEWRLQLLKEHEKTINELRAKIDQMERDAETVVETTRQRELDAKKAADDREDALKQQLKQQLDQKNLDLVNARERQNAAESRELRAIKEREEARPHELLLKLEKQSAENVRLKRKIGELEQELWEVVLETMTNEVARKRREVQASSTKATKQSPSDSQK